MESVFYDIINSERYYTYLKNIISNQLFYDTVDANKSEPKIYKSYIVVGDVVLRQVKISNMDCPMFALTETKCTYPYYTSSLRNENAGENFETEEATKISSTITGEFGVYDGSGYVETFSPLEPPTANISTLFIYFLLYLSN